MSSCRNPRCDSGNFLCGKCRRQFPQAAKALDERKQQGRSKSGRAARGAATAGFIVGTALTGGQAYAEPTQNSTNTYGNYSDSRGHQRGANKARSSRRETNYKGRQGGGSNQNR